MQQLQALGPNLQGQRGRARKIAAGPIQAFDQSKLHRVTSYEEDGWYRLRGRLGRQCRRGCRCDKHGHRTVNQIGRQCGQHIVATLGPPIFDRHVLAFDKANCFQAQAESAQTVRV